MVASKGNSVCEGVEGGQDRTERPREGGAKTRLEKRIRHAQESDPTSVQCAVRKEDLGCDWGH